MSLDFHTDYPNLIAAGFYDGSVAVYNMAEATQSPKYISSAKNGKHTDPVWQVSYRLFNSLFMRNKLIYYNLKG